MPTSKRELNSLHEMTFPRLTDRETYFGLNIQNTGEIIDEVNIPSRPMRKKNLIEIYVSISELRSGSAFPHQWNDDK